MENNQIRKTLTKTGLLQLLGAVVVIATGVSLIDTRFGQEDMRTRIERVYNDPNFASKRNDLNKVLKMYDAIDLENLDVKERKTIESFDANQYREVIGAYSRIGLIDANQLSPREKVYILRVNEQLKNAVPKGIGF